MFYTNTCSVVKIGLAGMHFSMEHVRLTPFDSLEEVA
jgi:hypothetical protein